MRTAFTIIELVFVIVILGILAAVGIPKLSATRDDARISKMMMMVTHGMEELGNYAMSQGTIVEDLTAMSQSLKTLVETGDATSSNGRVDIKMGNVSDCISIVSQDVDGGIEVKVVLGDAGTDTLCNRLQHALPVDGYSLVLTGTIVEI